MKQTLAVANSSNIDEVSYFPGHRVLQVTFKGGRTYRYEGVKDEVWEVLQAEPSVGKFVAGYVKGAYEFEPGEYEPCVQEGCEWPDGHDEDEDTPEHGPRIWDD